MKVNKRSTSELTTCKTLVWNRFTMVDPNLYFGSDINDINSEKEKSGLWKNIQKLNQ